VREEDAGGREAGAPLDLKKLEEFFFGGKRKINQRSKLAYPVTCPVDGVGDLGFLYFTNNITPRQFVSKYVLV
jgi:hypothetical protein